MDKLESLSHTAWECKYHVVFIPKCRRRKLYGELRKYLGEVFRKLAEQKESRIEEGHLMPDHVHMMIAIPPKYAVSQVVGYIKGKSAIHQAVLAVPFGAPFCQSRHMPAPNRRLAVAPGVSHTSRKPLDFLSFILSLSFMHSASKRDCGRPCKLPRCVWVRALGILLVPATIGGSCWADGQPRGGLDYGQTLCVPAERTYFSCQIGRKTVSLCGSNQITKTSGYLQYRFGRIGKEPELIYPPTQMHPRGQFRDSLVVSAQSYSYEIGFQRGESSYRIFADDAARAQSYGWGVFVDRIGEPLRMLSCTGQVFEDRTTLSRMYAEGVLDRLPGETAKRRFILQSK